MDWIGRRNSNFLPLGDGAETHVNELENGVASCTLKTNQVFPVLIVVMLHSCHLLISVSQMCLATKHSELIAKEKQQLGGGAGGHMYHCLITMICF